MSRTPGIPPAGKKLRIPFTAVVNIRGDKLYMSTSVHSRVWRESYHKFLYLLSFVTLFLVVIQLSLEANNIGEKVSCKGPGSGRFELSRSAP
jgi:hypothetical protein